VTKSGHKDLLLGKYEVLERIGSGGMAEVYKARTLGPGGFAKSICIKRVLPQFARDAAFIDMLVAEASVTSRLQHPNVAQVFDLEEEQGEYYIVMELVDGCDFLQLLTHRARLKQRLEENKVLYIMAQVGRGLDYAHNAIGDNGQPLHIVHRDVSPSNILLGREGGVKLVDFGVAKSGQPATQDVQRRAGALKGKLGYMSPELVTNQEPSKSSDIFALGIVLWEALTLRRLFLGSTEVQTLLNVRDVRIEKKLLRHDYISPEVVAVIRHALKPRSEDRFTSAGEFCDAIEDILFERRVRTGPTHVASLVGETYVTEPKEAVTASAIKEAVVPKPRRTLRADTYTAIPAVVPQFSDLPAEVTNQGSTPGSPSPWAVFKASEDKHQSVEETLDLTSATYRLKGEGIPLFGPISYAGLLRMIHSGSVSSGEEVSVNEGSWFPVDELELPGDRVVLASEQVCIQEGPLNRIRLPQLIYECAIARISGTLKVSEGTISKEIIWRNGLITDVRSNLKSELLARFLVSFKGYDRAQISRALNHAEQAGIRLGDALVELKLMSGAELSRALEDQCRHRITELFEWSEGWYELSTGSRPGHSSVGLVEDPLTILVRALRQTADERFLASVFEPFLEHRLVIKGNPRVDFARFRFESQETEMLQSLKEGENVREVVSRLTSSKEALICLERLLFILHQTDFIALEPESSEV
jgi:eukaryotic-like serine/threonine-protein kinase